ncbi:S49 family peptidase [Planctomycetota bacterium]|nr:S49 family peptidase [Planctomycetota bacterium]
MNNPQNEHPPAPVAPQPAPNSQPQMASSLLQKKRMSPLRIMGIIALIGFIVFNVLMFVLPMGLAFIGGGGGGDPHGVHEFYREGEGESKVAIIPINGVIMEGGGGGLFSVPGLDPVSMATDGLRLAAADDTVKAVVLEINSPGGGVGASDMIHHEILKFKAKSGKPIVVYMKDLAASGGYYIAAPADYIIAGRTTLTGSIGVIIQGFNFHGTLTEIAKGRDATVKAGGNKTMGSMFGDPDSPEYAEGRELLQELVDEMHVQFRTLVKEGRGDALQPGWETYADGRILSASQAKTHGFIDEIGYFESVLKYLEGKGISSPTVVEYGRSVSPLSMLGLESEDQVAAAKALQPAFSQAALTSHVQQTLRLYPGKPMAIWVP